jgi:hypothetical protein
MTSSVFRKHKIDTHWQVPGLASLFETFPRLLHKQYHGKKYETAIDGITITVVGHGCLASAGGSAVRGRFAQPS